jgi:hypothetical protein
VRIASFASASRSRGSHASSAPAGPEAAVVCTRTVTIATLTRSGHVTVNRVAFTGRIGGKALKTGRYRAVFTAIDPVGASPSRSLSFTIVKP